MRHSERLERIPPYLFAQLERKIAEKRAAGTAAARSFARRSQASTGGALPSPWTTTAR